MPRYLEPQVPLTPVQADRQATPLVRPNAPALRASLSLRVLAALAIGALLYVAHAAFIPIALGVLFSLILTAPVEALHRLGAPRSVSAVVVLVLLAALIGGSVNLLWTPAQNWWAAAPQTLRTIERKARPVSQFMNRLEALSNRADQIGNVGERTGASAPLADASAQSSSPPAHGPIAVQILDQTRSALISIMTVMMLMLFLLAGGPPMLARMSAALASDLQSTHTLGVVNAVRSELSRYYGSLALINLALGLATAAIMMLLGMPNPLLWGAVAAILNFIPYVGSATALLLLTVVAFVTFNNLGHVAAVAASYLALATLEGQIVQPLVVGRRLELNPMIVFLALWFGGWFWGIAGIVIAVPALVSMKVVAAKSRLGGPLTEFLSPQPSPMRQLAPSMGKNRPAAATDGMRYPRLTP